MKKLTLNQVEDLIKNGLFSIKEPNNPCGSWNKYPGGDASYYPLEWFNQNLQNYPEEFKKVYVTQKENEIIVAPDFPELLNQSNLLNTTFKPLLLSWYDINDQILSDQSDIFSVKKRELRYKLMQSGLKLMSQIIIEVIPVEQLTSIENIKFWNFLYKNSNGISSINIVQLLTQLFENIDDVISFSKILKNKYSKIFNEATMYKAWLKALMKFAKDYSLKNVPSILFHKLNYDGSESNKIEVIKALRKYDYLEIQDTLVKLYKINHQAKVQLLLKEILLENDYFNNLENKNIFLTEMQQTIYKQNIRLDFSVLKSMIKDDSLLACTLLQLIKLYTKTKGYDVNYEINYTAQYVDFILMTTDRNECDTFKDNIILFCNFAFSDQCLTSYPNLAERDRGTRIEHEKKPEVSNGFNKLLDLWLLKEKKFNIK